MLEREEYVEQVHLFRTLGERLPENVPMQDVLQQVRAEVLATTRLPLAIDFLLAELKHSGVLWLAMDRLKHYFAPFQTYVMREAEDERGRFDLRMGAELLRLEAQCRGDGASRQGLFMYQFECLCRHRLRYDPGLTAMAQDDWYDAPWQEWILMVRSQVGLIDLADMIFVRSQHCLTRNQQPADEPPGKPVLFGEKEGRIAWANRQRDPLYLFAAMQRHLNYPPVPRPPRPVEKPEHSFPMLVRRLERIEARLKLLEEEQKGGLDITRFYGPDAHIPEPPAPDGG